MSDKRLAHPGACLFVGALVAFIFWLSAGRSDSAPGGIVSFKSSSLSTSSALAPSQIDTLSAEQRGSNSERRYIDWHFALIFDMGSSGTRVHVYRWQPAWPLRSVVELANLKYLPGVSYYASTTNVAEEISERVESSIIPLVDFAKTIVPPKHWASCSIHAKCTAGCRLLSERALAATLEGVRRALRASGMRFRDDWARMIPGAEEAVLDWIGMNAALGLLHTAEWINGTVLPLPTVGVMDVGGASAQIAYSIAAVRTVGLASAPEPPNIVDGTDWGLVTDQTVFPYGHGIYHLRLANNVEHTIYAVSRIHYGLHDFFRQLLVYDVDDAGRYSAGNASDNGKISHPCVYRGVYLYTAGGQLVHGAGDGELCIQAIGIFLTSATARDLGQVRDMLPAPPVHRDATPFVGTDNFFELYRLATHVVTDSKRHKVKSTGRQTMSSASLKHAPRPKGSLPPHSAVNNEIQANKGVSSGGFTVSTLHACLDEQSTSVTPHVFLQAAKFLCGMEWWEVEVRYSKLLSSTALRDSCFGMIYMFHLTSGVYDLPPNAPFQASKTLSRCPGLNLPDLGVQYPSLATSPNSLADALKSNIKAVYDSSWALGAVVLHMENHLLLANMGKLSAKDHSTTHQSHMEPQVSQPGASGQVFKV